MKVEVLEEKDSPLLSRKEYKFKLLFEGATPSKDKVMEAIKKYFKEKQELIAIKKISNVFGKPEAVINVYHYSEEKAFNSLEPKPKKKEEN